MLEKTFKIHKKSIPLKLNNLYFNNS